MQQFLQFITWHLCTAQRVSGFLVAFMRSSIIAVATSGFTYCHTRYCYVNLQLKRDKRCCFAKFTVTIELIPMTIGKTRGCYCSY
jgi:hypothetical protein